MIARKLVDVRSDITVATYQGTIDELSAAGWNSWAVDWQAFRDLAVEPIDDLVASRGDRDEFSVSASRLIDFPGLRVSADRRVFLDSEEVFIVEASFTWIWDPGMLDDVAEFVFVGDGSGSEVLGQPDALPVQQMLAAVEESTCFRALSAAQEPRHRMFSVSD